MKRFFTMIVAISSMLVAMAQNPMVTLSHNGGLTFFTNVEAFQSAIDAAENGDILYLSDGDFILKDGKCTITKRLSIVGSGYTSHLLGDIHIDMQSNPGSWMDAPLFDGVRLDKLLFSDDFNSYSNLSKTEIIRTQIKEVINGGCAGTEISYDKCNIEKIDFNGSGSVSVVVKNSKLGSCKDYMQYITVINCNINSIVEYPRYMISSILNKEDDSPSFGGTLINCLFRFNPTQGTIYDCYVAEGSGPILDDNLDATIDLSNYLGQDGKVVGIYGGESPFSENPSLPTVDTSKSSVEYDATGNRLKISISVKAD